MSDLVTYPRMADIPGVTVSKTVVGRGPKAVGSGVLVIQDFETEMKKCKPGDVIESKSFKVMENFFFIRVIPNGSSEASVGHIGIFVVNMSDTGVVVSKFTLSDGEKTWNMEEEKDLKKKGSGQNSWGWNTHDACKAVLKDGALVIEGCVEGRRPGDRGRGDHHGGQDLDRQQLRHSAEVQQLCAGGHVQERYGRQRLFTGVRGRRYPLPKMV